MVLHHIPDDAVLVKVAPSPLSAKGLFEAYLHPKHNLENSQAVLSMLSLKTNVACNELLKGGKVMLNVMHSALCRLYQCILPTALG